MLLLMGLFLAAAQPAEGAAITSAGSGDWEAGATWVGVAPGAGEIFLGIKPGLLDLIRVRAK